MNPPKAMPLPADPAAPAPAGSAARLRQAAFLVTVLVIAGAVAGLLPRWRQQSELRATTADLAMQTVSVVSPAPGKTAGGLVLPAEIKPLVESPIYARASGYLKRWLADIGTKVETGQLLAEIDTPDLNQELVRSRAELAQAEAALTLAKSTAARWADLLKTGSVSEQESAEKQADLALKTATVAAARADVRRLEELQSFAHVTAPFAGTITARTTDVGELIAAGSGKQLFRLAQTGTLRVYVRVPQPVVRGIVPGQTAELALPEQPGKTFTAKVVRSSGAMDAQSRTLLVELEMDNPDGAILAGSFAEVQFPELHVDVPLTLPSNTLLFGAEGPRVGVVGADGKVGLRNVTLGRDFGPTVEIVSGVTPADRVIANPPDSLVSGATVRVVDPAASAAGK